MVRMAALCTTLRTVTRAVRSANCRSRASRRTTIPPARPREPPARALRAGLAVRDAGVVADRGSTSPKRVTTGRIAMFCSLVQIGQFWSRRLWRQNDGIADSEHYMNPAMPRAAVRSPEEKDRGAQIHLGPPESQGSGGAVP